MAKNVECSRCGYDGQYIDTGRYIKFGDNPGKTYYLCDPCWDVVKDHFYRGPMPKHDSPKNQDPNKKKR